MSNPIKDAAQKIKNMSQGLTNTQSGQKPFEPSGFFKDVLTNVNNLQQDLLGPDYAYWEKINTPTELEMSGDGNLTTLAKDVAGLIGYVELLVSGGGPASKEQGPLGNRFFLKTGAKCKDKSTGKDTDRYIYVSNVPTGSIPFISAGLNQNFKDFRGLVPGVIENIGKVNPFAMFQAFMVNSNSECIPLTMKVTPTDRNEYNSTQREMVLKSDVANMNPCYFTLNNGTNPVTGQKCSFNVQGFENMYPKGNINSNIPDDIISKLFFAGFGGLLLYILYLIVSRTNKLNKK